MAEFDGEVLPGLWQFSAEHPEWTEEEGEDGWDRLVAWWATSTSRGLLLVDPLITAWDELDRLVAAHGGCAGVVRTIHWHQRSVAAVAARYRTSVWGATQAPDSTPRQPLDHVLRDRAEICDGIQAFILERDDEIALWLPQQAALLFGDAMLRRDDGELRVCPDSWTQPPGGGDRLRALLGALDQLPVKHVLVSHGPLVTGSGLESLQAAIR